MTSLARELARFHCSNIRIVCRSKNRCILPPPSSAPAATGRRRKPPQLGGMSGMRVEAKARSRAGGRATERRQVAVMRPTDDATVEPIRGAEKTTGDRRREGTVAGAVAAAVQLGPSLSE